MVVGAAVSLFVAWASFGLGMHATPAGGTPDGAPIDRLDCETRLARVYHEHVIGSRPEFERMYPVEALRKRIARLERQELELAQVAGIEISKELLDAERRRIERDGRLPDRLQKVYATFGSDDRLIDECFVRPVLVGRMHREILAGSLRDSPETSRTLREFERKRANAARWERAAIARATEREILPGELAAGSCLQDSWVNGGLENDPEEREDYAAVWTGSLLLVFGGGDDGGPRDRGLRYDPLTDSWEPMSSAQAPSPRFHPTAIWTGSEMIVWGGGAELIGSPLDGGGRYDPISDTWNTVSGIDAPSAREFHTAVWTGAEMIVWGGWDGTGTLADGARYDPTLDTWSPTSSVKAPVARAEHTAVWTGAVMIVWGGLGGDNSGARYSPGLDEWSPTSLAGAPAARFEHVAVWTGFEMLVWGGVGGGAEDFPGGGYDPVTDSWRVLSTVNAPTGRSSPTAVWTGSWMIVWGGYISFGPFVVGTGALYDPSSDSWKPVTRANAPAPRAYHSAVWTGDSMLVWGGVSHFFDNRLGSGGRYHAATDTWTPMSSTSSGPNPRSGHSAVWTGTQMIIWGGTDSCTTEEFSSGWKYDPLVDDWDPMEIAGAPAGRYGHTAVWTGTEMIVWGGSRCAVNPLGTGARYDPVLDSWRSVGENGSPEARFHHSAVWTGSEMVVWGGEGQGGTILDSGYRYDPVTDEWRPISILDSPASRKGHTAVWTEDAMLIWGGAGASGATNTVGRYELAGDSWSPTSVDGAPAGRQGHTAVWTGMEMIVWGGAGLANGGRYDPQADAWSPVASFGAPSGRSGHTAVWTGEEMIVWGGGVFIFGTNTGGRYDPQLDMWDATPTLNAPRPRINHTAVWADGRMIVWGGFSGTELVGSGGRYFGPGDDDLDEDGFGACAGDCDDSDAAVNPEAHEIPGNAVDENCDGEAACDPTALWKNRGEFVRCIARACEGLVASGAVSREECDGLISKAAMLQTR